MLSLNSLSAKVAEVVSSGAVSPVLRAPLQAGETLADYEMPSFVNSLLSFTSFLQTPSGIQFRRRVALILVFSSSGALLYRLYGRRPHKEKAVVNVGKDGKRSGKVAVDAVFFRRLWKIFKIVIPSAASTEVAYIVILTALLIARTLFSIYIAELIGVNAQSLVGRKWGRMWNGIKAFAVVTIPAAMVNSGLKYFTEMISLRFRVRLSEHVHDEYLKGVNFYICSNLGKDKIENADQRVTADIKDFSDEISQLYSSLLKPTLDVGLFTYKLGQILGWQGPLCMHMYFVLQGYIKKNIMPNLGKMVAKESELEGNYRSAHQRLITNSEEIAFYDGSAKEKIIINKALHEIENHVSYARYLKAAIGVFDGLLVKYYASIAGYIALLSPLVLNLDSVRSKSSEDLTRDYIRNSQYLGQLSTAVGQLVIVGNRLTQIAGYTSRVSELLEMVKDLEQRSIEPFEIKDEENRKEEACSIVGLQEWLKQWKTRCDEQHEQRITVRRARSANGSTKKATSSNRGGKIIENPNTIEFRKCDIVSPDGKLLVADLNFTVHTGVNVMVTGPNGCGKSSLFRLIGELWPLSSGELHRPPKEDILFVPQKPYLVLGTLRDQIIYPHTKQDMHALGITDDDLTHLLATVDPAQNIRKEWKFDDVRDWFHAFSGGQKQRVAMARLMYHRPMFAILDECTSAVSDEVEDNIYQTCKTLGITIFTVSHRPSLARHHDVILRFEGNGEWTVTQLKHEKPAQGHVLPAMPASEAKKLVV